MKLSIIIPQYNEGEKIIFPLLSSIDNQLGINFSDIEIVIVNDHSEVILSESFLSSFVNIRPKYIISDKNNGPGQSRNIGMDNSSGDYIIFCDADDIFHNVGSIGLIISEINLKSPDIFITTYLYESFTDNSYSYREVKYEDNTRIHAKCFKREFLSNNNIRFLDDLRFNEDTYFVGVAMALAKNKTFSDVVTYVWKYNKESVTRINDMEFNYKCYHDFIYAGINLMNRISKEIPEEMPIRMANFLLHVYFTMQLPYWDLEQASGYKRKSLSMFGKFFKENIKIYNKVNKEMLASSYMSVCLDILNNQIKDKANLSEFIDSLTK